MRNLYAFAMTLLLFSCGGSESSNEIKLDDIPFQKISSHSVELPVEILAPEQIYCLDDGFIVKDNVKEGFLKYIPYSLDAVVNYGFVGNGSGEFIMPRVSQLDNNRLMVSSINPNDQILKFDNGAISATSLNLKHKEHFTGANYLAQIDQESYLVYKVSESQIEIVDDSTGEVQGYNFFPFESNDNVSQFNKANVIFDSLMMNYWQSSNTLFIGFYLFPYFINVDMATKQIVSNVKILTDDPVNRYTVDQRGGLDYGDPVIYYFNHVATEDYNWVYYRGYRRSEIGEKLPEIHQFSKEGKLIKRYKVDNELRHFGVSPDNKTIYALILNEDLLTEVVKFTL